MLVLTRKPSQSIMIGDDVEIQVLSVAGREGPDRDQRAARRRLFRNEVYQRIEAERADDGIETEQEREDEALERRRGAASGSRPSSQASVSNIATTTVTTVSVRQTSRTLNRTLPFVLVAGDAAGARAVGRAPAQLLAAAALERHLLLERQLDLRHALSHSHLSHRARPPAGRHG